ncbi:hypothetical protein ACJ4V0_15845 [Phreatobacter sp. HK31-P]
MSIILTILMMLAIIVLSCVLAILIPVLAIAWRVFCLIREALAELDADEPRHPTTSAGPPGRSGV